MNPIQAMKQRREQQQQEAEERRLQQLQEAEEMRLARRAASNSQPPSPQHASERAEVTAAQSLVIQTAAALPLQASEVRQPSEEPSLAPQAVEGSMLKSANSAAKQPSVATATKPVTTAEMAPKPPLLTESATKLLQSTEATAKPSLPADPEWPSPEAVLTPLERRQLRQAKANSPRASESQPQLQIQPHVQPDQAADARPETPRSSAATERLRTRMQQRETNGRSSEPRSSSRPPTGAAGGDSWRERIEARQREEQEQQVQEQTEKQRTDERSSKRNDAMRRVMERQAQRQSDVISLEA